MEQRDYTIKEASEILGITVRSVQTRCKVREVNKRNGRYIITSYLLKLWKEDIDLKEGKTQSETQSETQSANGTQDGTESLQKELDAALLAYKTLVVINEELKLKINDLEDKLSVFDIAPNERIEVFTDKEYSIFQKRLTEWFSLQKDIEHKDELFNAKEKSMSELLEHYKNQWKYQKKQSTKIVDMHQTLIDTIQKQGTLSIQRQVIEAHEKGVINDQWKPKPKGFDTDV